MKRMAEMMEEFDEADSERLRQALPMLRPHFEAFAVHFYDCIESHPDARRGAKDFLLANVRIPHQN